MRAVRRKAAVILLLCAALLTGCGDSAHYRKAERGAQRYYRDKYGCKETVTDSFKAGNSGLFGFIGVKDRAYEMSDGAMVYWNDSEEYYADNRQAEENKNGGYLKHDRRHEERMVLADPEAAVYRAVFSQRVKEQIDEYGRVGFYILMDIPDLPEGVRLWEYDAKKSGDPDYRMWVAAENGVEKAQYHGVKEDALFYVGEVSWEEYRD